MADNVTADAGSGGAVFATDDVSSVHYPITKITIGAMDSAGTVLTGGAGVVDAGCLRVAIATDAATVTANLSATDNAVLDAIAASVAGTLTVGSHAVTNAGTFATQATLQAGTAEIGKLAAGTASIGDIGTVTTVTTCGTVTNLAQMGGAAIAMGTGVRSAGTQRVTIATDDVVPASQSGTWTVDLGANNDVTMATLPDTAAGDLAAIAAALAGTLTVTGGGGGVEYTEDAAAAANPVGGAMIVVREDARAGSLTTTDGDNVALRGNNSGELYVLDTDANALLTTIDADTSTIAGDTTSIDGKITACNTGAVVISSGTITANLGATDNAVLDSIVTNTTGLAGTVSGSELQVDIVAALPAGTNAIGKLAANSGVDIGDVDVLTLPGVAGDVAHDTADSGNPIKIGAKATNTVEGQTQVAANDRVDLLADLNGCLVTRPHTTLEEIITEQVSNTNGTSTAFSNFAAGGAGVHNYITTISVYNSSATNGYIDFRDGTGGAIVFTAPLPTVGGSVINLPVPLKFAANTAVAYDVSGALSTVYISVVGFQAQG